MDHVTLSLAVGAVAGALVAIPMIFQRSSARSCFSAFFVYLFAAVLVFNGRLPYLPWWGAGNGRRHDADRSPALRLFGQGAQGDPPSWCSTHCSSVS